MQSAFLTLTTLGSRQVAAGQCGEVSSLGRWDAGLVTPLTPDVAWAWSQETGGGFLRQVPGEGWDHRPEAHRRAVDRPRKGSPPGLASRAQG